MLVKEVKHKASSLRLHHAGGSPDLGSDHKALCDYHIGEDCSGLGSYKASCNHHHQLIQVFGVIIMLLVIITIMLELVQLLGVNLKLHVIIMMLERPGIFGNYHNSSSDHDHYALG